MTKTFNDSEVVVGLVQRAAGIADQVTETLRNLILSGAIGEDDVLTEAALGVKLGVSRTPVREALAHLEREGLLEPAGLRGKRVRSFSEAQIKELFWLRRTIEGATVAEVAQRPADPQHLALLEALIEQQRGLAEHNERARFLEIDHQFHAALVKTLGFSHVTDLLRGLRYTFDLIGLKPTYSAPNRLGEVLLEHEAILKALRSRNPDKAKAAMETHLRRTETLVLQAMKTSLEEASR
jgi:GntR family transcriptional regulator, rspAB operon transcriptional repressor